MSDLSLRALSEKMRDIDFAMLSTRTEGGAVAARPMSNNRQVEFDGDAYFFTCGDTRTVADIERDPRVGLAYQGKSGMLGMKPFFVTKDLDAWFKQGVDTPGLTMIKVHAERLHYWDGYDEGELDLTRKETLQDA